MAQNKFLTLSGLSVFKDNIISIIEENELVTSSALVELNNKINNVPKLYKVTYTALCEYVEKSKLIPGAKYRIIDYETIVETSVYWQSANHPFDIIVTAISNNRLDENATCCLSDRDTDGYFANCGIESWKIKYTIYNDASYGWANSNGKGVIYWMQDNNRNFCPFDFKNIRINPNGGSGATPQDALAKAAEQGVTTDDIASRYMLSTDGFYYAFSSFDGTIDRSLNKHFIQDSGFGILGKSDEVQYLSGTVIICPENTEIHHVTVNYGYWSAIIVTGCLAGDTAKTVIRNLNINHMSKSYIIVGQAYDTFINSIVGSYVYIGFTFGQPNFIGYMNNSYMYVVYRATSNIIKYAHGVAISCQRLECNDFDLLQYVSYPGIFDKNTYNATALSDGTKVTKINYLTCKQALVTGSETSYLNVRDLVTAGSLKENTGYRQILYFDNGGILKTKAEFQIYNINTDTTYIADGDTPNDKKISINDNIINVALRSHTHTDLATGQSLDALSTIVTNGFNDLSGKITQNAIDIGGLTTQLSSLGQTVGVHDGAINVLDIAVAKLKDKTVGSETEPIYWNDGAPTKCKHTLAQDVTADSKLTDTNYYITGFTWSNGTTAGPTGTITRNGTTNINVNSIPAASGNALYDLDADWVANTQQSGIVTTDKQSFSGQKFFNNGIWIGTENCQDEEGTDNLKIHFGDTASIWIGESTDERLTLNAGGVNLTVDGEADNIYINGGDLYINSEEVAVKSDINPPMKYTSKTLSFASSMYLDNPTANYCTLCSFTNTASVSYPDFYIKFNTSYADGSMFHFIIKKTTNQTVTQYMRVNISSNISGATVKIAGLNTTYAYINKAFTSVEINVLYSNKVFYAIINQYK